MLYGPLEKHLRILEQEFGVQVRTRGNHLKLIGSAQQIRLGRRVLEELSALVRQREAQGRGIAADDVRAAISAMQREPQRKLSEAYLEVLPGNGPGRRSISVKTLAQRRYYDLVKKCDLVLAVGAAGAGKTYLAVAMALAALERGEVSRVILTRPVVEAGERLGFLPGDIKNKVDPYLRPLYDALYEMRGNGRVQQLVEDGAIELAPLAYMRGRTLNASFVILDEAQNTTPEQMKMFLTRLGYNSRAVVTGDITQVDLPRGKENGFSDALRVLEGVAGIGVMRFTPQDAVRHRLVQSIINAYEKRGPEGLPGKPEGQGEGAAEGAPDAADESAEPLSPTPSASSASPDSAAVETRSSEGQPGDPEGPGEGGVRA